MCWAMFLRFIAYCTVKAVNNEAQKSLGTEVPRAELPRRPTHRISKPRNNKQKHDWALKNRREIILNSVYQLYLISWCYWPCSFLVSSDTETDLFTSLPAEGAMTGPRIASSISLHTDRLGSTMKSIKPKQTKISMIFIQS